ncbi:MFS transporter [Agrobacterium vitis]|nr:MFS transporter [Agrobacterium vitis]MCM2438738.1 MFS transporter [Agrobacterium vitis]
MVAIFALAGGVAALDAQAVYYLMPRIVADLGLTDAQVGILGSAVLVGWSVAAFAFGQISDRLGRRKPFLVLAFLAMAALSGLSAIVATFVGLVVARVLMGLAEGPVIPVKQAIVMAESTPSRRGLNMGIVQNFGAQLLGTLIGPIAVVSIADAYGWRNAFLLSALPSILVVWLILRYIREPATEATSNAFVAPRSSLMSILMRRNVFLCALIGIANIAWFFVLLTFLPLILTRQAGLSSQSMSYVMAMIGAAGAVSALLVPGLSDRIGRKTAIAIFSAVGVVAPLGAILLGGNPWLVGLALFCGCMLLGTMPLFMATVPQESVLPADRATATGLVLGIGQLLGGTIGPIVGGQLSANFGPMAPMWLAGGLAALAGLLALFLVPQKLT